MKVCKKGASLNLLHCYTGYKNPLKLSLLMINEMRGKDGNTQGLLAHGSGVVSLHPGRGGHMHRTAPDRPRVGGKTPQGIIHM